MRTCITESCFKVGHVQHEDRFLQDDILQEGMHYRTCVRGGYSHCLSVQQVAVIFFCF